MILTDRIKRNSVKESSPRFKAAPEHSLGGKGALSLRLPTITKSRDPNFLPVHLMLAVVYSELGQAAEARTEAAEVLRLNPQFSLEVHKQRSPLKDPAVLERHLAVLHKAGLR